MIGHIILDTKQTGRRSAGNPHATSDVAGGGKGFTVQILRHSQRKRGAMARLNLRNTAPALDPTLAAARQSEPEPDDKPLISIRLRVSKTSGPLNVPVPQEEM